MLSFIYFLEFYLNVPSLFVTIGVNETINMARNSLNCCKKKGQFSSSGAETLKGGGVKLSSPHFLPQTTLRMPKLRDS